MGRRKVCHNKVLTSVKDEGSLDRAGPASLTKSEQTPSPNKTCLKRFKLGIKQNTQCPPTWATQSVSIGF